MRTCCSKGLNDYILKCLIVLKTGEILKNWRQSTGLEIKNFISIIKKSLKNYKFLTIMNFWTFNITPNPKITKTQHDELPQCRLFHQKRTLSDSQNRNPSKDPIYRNKTSANTHSKNTSKEKLKNKINFRNKWLFLLEYIWIFETKKT